MRRSIPLLLPLCLALATLAGCGNKGPLVLPTKPLPAVKPATLPAAASSAAPAHSGSAARPATSGSTANPTIDPY